MLVLLTAVIGAIVVKDVVIPDLRINSGRF